VHLLLHCSAVIGRSHEAGDALNWYHIIVLSTCLSSTNKFLTGLWVVPAAWRDVPVFLLLLFSYMAGLVLKTQGCYPCVLSAQALEWAPLPDGGVAVTTDYKTYHADKLVISSGAWMDQMVPELKVTVDNRQRCSRSYCIVQCACSTSCQSAAAHGWTRWCLNSR
jgi:hypothetical protein